MKRFASGSCELSALDEVARQRERRSGEADERHAISERGARTADRLEDEGEGLHRIALDQASDVGRGAHRAVDDWSFSLRELEAHVERLHDQQDVGKEDGGIHAELLDREHGHLGGERRATEVEESEPRPDRAILGKEAPGLPQKPHRRERHRPAAAGGKERVHGWDWPPPEPA